MTKKKSHKPSDSGPFGFMAGTVIDDNDIVAADPNTWVESTSDPLFHHGKPELGNPSASTWKPSA